MICLETVKRFCKDFTKIENYEEAMTDTTQVWHCHHRLETHNSDGEKRLVDLTRDELKSLGMYFDRPPEELVFLKREEHRRLHRPMYGKHHTEETKIKLSNNEKGEKNPFFGKTHSEETKRKISEKNKGNKTWLGKHHTEETKKKMSEVQKKLATWKGKKHTEETKRKMSEARKAYWAKKKEEDK